MNYTFVQVKLALEELQEGIIEAATTPTQDEETNNIVQGEELDTQSTAIDADAAALTQRTEKLGDVIDMVERTDAPMAEPLPEATQQGVDIALEALGLGLESDSPDRATKETMVQRLKRYFMAMLEGMRRFCAHIVTHVRNAYTWATDRSTRNKARAEKAKKAMEEKSFNRKMGEVNGRNTGSQSASDLFSASLLKSMVRPNGVTIVQASKNVVDYIRQQNKVINRGLLLDTLTTLSDVMKDPAGVEPKAKEFMSYLDRIGDVADQAATSEQRKEAGVSDDMKVGVSAPFFGGHRAWIATPKVDSLISKFDHGLSVLDKVNAEERNPQVPTVENLREIITQVLDLDAAVVEYRNHVGQLSAVEEKLKQFASEISSGSKAMEGFSGSDVSSTRVRALAEAMNAALPKLVKGPQVAVVRYAATVGTMLMDYVQAGMKAYTEVDGVDNSSRKKFVDNAGRALA